MYDAVMPCVVCDAPVAINLGVWNSTEQPVALCNDCDIAVPWPLLRVVWLLRYQIGWLSGRLQQLEAPA